MIEGVLVGFILGLLCCGARELASRRRGYQPKAPIALPTVTPPPPPPRPRRYVIDHEGIRFEEPRWPRS